MSELKPFLLELGVEEIPHWMIVPALADIERLFKDVCALHQLDPGTLKLDGTPRRLTLRTALAERQADREELVLGPPQSAGPGAANGFARKNGVDVAALAVEATPKGVYYALRRHVAGRSVQEILAEALPGIITKIPWPKAMYWTGKGGRTFIRPVRWIVALLGESVVEFEFAGVKSGALTRGHRRMSKGDILVTPESYEALLEKNGVILSAEKRKKRIVSGIKKLIKGTGYELIPDAALLDDLVYLTEFPTPILGTFREEFLDLPQEVLSTVMRHHQRYFTLRDVGGKMAPRFISVMNIRADKKGYVLKGNERVLEARFNDARFFWSVDRQRTLSSRVPELKNVTFQARLGSYHDKTLGVHDGVTRMAAALGLDTELARRAAMLSKVDLMTEMVKELTELQGVMGGLYARADGEPEEVAKAVYEHYLPQSMEDPIPSSAYGRLLSVADKLDTLEGCFGIGMVPSGSKDPFALRRAAQGVVKVLVEGRLKLDLHKAVCAGTESTRLLFAERGATDASSQLWDFLVDRIKYYFRDVRGFAYDEVNAVLAGDWATLPDVELRLTALKQVRQTENFEPLAASFKRIGNILKQASWTGGTVDAGLLEEGPERELATALDAVLARVLDRRQSDDYLQAFQSIATLRGAVDAFFDKVLVNAPDAAVRSNRLALLGGLFREVSSIADFSEIVTSSTSE
jgi:glycyl-tRNA synthetase beta chain